MDAGAAGSVDGVADLLRRAGWTLQDLEDELGKSPNLAHAGSSDMAYR
jgi:hypothetical protein